MGPQRAAGRKRGSRASAEADADVAGDRILATLADEDCRAILAAVEDRALSAAEIAATCDLPESTTYRKLERLESVGLLETGTRIDADRTHRREHRAAAAGVGVTIDDGEMCVTVAYQGDRDPLVCRLGD